MSTNSAKIFSIEGYEDSDFKKKIGLFQLQVAPDKFDISFGQNPSETSKNVNGDVLVACHCPNHWEIDPKSNSIV